MKHFLTIILFCLISFKISAQNPEIAILGAFNDEVKLLEDSLQQKQEHFIRGIRYLTGTLRGKQVVVNLTGVGKVNAAMSTSLLLATWQPKYLIFTGIAGGIAEGLAPGDIVIGKQSMQHDFGRIDSTKMTIWTTRNPIAGKQNPRLFDGDAFLVALAQNVGVNVAYQFVGKKRLPKVSLGIIATGDVFVNSKEKVKNLRENTQADAIEMEGAAVAQVCYQLGVPCLIIRSISDNADGQAHKDLPNFEKVAAFNSASLVMAMLGKL